MGLGKWRRNEERERLRFLAKCSAICFEHVGSGTSSSFVQSPTSSFLVLWLPGPRPRYRDVACFNPAFSGLLLQQLLGKCLCCSYKAAYIVGSLYILPLCMISFSLTSSTLQLSKVCDITTITCCHIASVQQGSDQGRTSSATAPHSFPGHTFFSYVSPSHAISFTYKDRFHICFLLFLISILVSKSHKAMPSPLQLHPLTHLVTPARPP